MTRFIYPFSTQEEKCIRGQQGETVLHYAAKRGYNKVVIKLLQIGDTINEREKYGNTPLHLALKQKHVVTSAVLISYKCNVNLKNEEQCAPIHYAVLTGSLGIVQKLLENGADINEINGNGDTPLHLALKAQQPFVAMLLICKETIRYSVNHNSETALHYAALYGYLEITESLLQLKNTNIDAQDSSGNTALHYSLISGHLSIAIILSDYKASCSLSNNKQRTALHYTAKNNYIEIIYHQLSNICDINKQDQNGDTALHLAIYYQNIRLAKILIYNGASSIIENLKSSTPFDYAYQQNCTELVDIFTSRNVDHQNDNGDTLLHLATINNRRNVVSQLICNFANYGIKNYNNESILHLSAKLGHYHFTKIFLLIGIDAKEQDANGNTPLHLALLKDSKKIAELLINNIPIDGEVDMVNKDGNSVLHLLASVGYKQLLLKLLAKIPDINKQNNEGRTPLHLAVLHKHWNSTLILINYNADVNIRDHHGETALNIIKKTHKSEYSLDLELERFVK